MRQKTGKRGNTPGWQIKVRNWCSSNRRRKERGFPSSINPTQMWLTFLVPFIESKRYLPQPTAACFPFSHLSPKVPAVLLLTDGCTHEHFFFLLLMLNMIYRLELLFIIIHFLSAVHWRLIEMPACSLIYLVKYLFQGLGHMIGVWVSFGFMHYEKQDALTFSHHH